MILQNIYKHISARYLLANAVHFCSSKPISSEELINNKDLQAQAQKFEEDWNNIAKQKEEQQLNALKEELTEYQIKRIDILVQSCLQFNNKENEALTLTIAQKLSKIAGISPLTLNMEWPVMKQFDQGEWPPKDIDSEQFFNKLMGGNSEALTQLFGGMGTGGGQIQTQQASGSGEQQADKVEEKKEEVAKQSFDVELTAFDASTKIKIIKEVRSLLGLGLKEAKETVEKAPVVIKKQINKSEAEELKENLEKIGCTINLK